MEMAWFLAPEEEEEEPLGGMFASLDVWDIAKYPPSVFACRYRFLQFLEVLAIKAGVRFCTGDGVRRYKHAAQLLDWYYRSVPGMRELAIEPVEALRSC